MLQTKLVEASLDSMLPHYKVEEDEEALEELLAVESQVVVLEES